MPSGGPRALSRLFPAPSRFFHRARMNLNDSYGPDAAGLICGYVFAPGERGLAVCAVEESRRLWQVAVEDVSQDAVRCDTVRTRSMVSRGTS